MATPGLCTQILEGLGYGGCVDGPLLRTPKRFILALESQQFASQAEAKTKAAWLTDIIAKELFPLALIDDAEDKSTEDSVPVTAFGRPVFQQAGKVGMKIMMLLTPDQNRILQTYNNKKVGLYVVMDGGTILGTTNGTIVKPLKLAYFHASTLKFPVTLDGFAYSSVEIQFESIDELNSKPFYITGSDAATAAIPWYPATDLVPMTKITLTPGTVAAFTFTCAFAYVDPTTGASVPIIGITAPEVALTKADGSSDAVVSVTESGTIPGTYTIVGTAITSGTVRLVPTATSLFYSDAEAVSAA